MTVDATVTLAVVGVLATCVGGLLWVLKFVFSKLLPRFDKGNEVMATLVSATKTNTEITKNADIYLRQRNGLDDINHAELIKVTKAIPVKMQRIADSQAKALSVSLKKIKEQHVEHAHVDKLTATEIVKEEK